MPPKPTDHDQTTARERVAKGIRLLVREGLIPNAGHINAESGWASFPLLLSDVKGILKKQTWNKQQTL